MLLVDIELMEGECENCGVVRLVKKRNRWACAEGVKEQKARKGKHGVPVLITKKLIAAAGECFLCGSTKNLVLDHSHETGRLRGILCLNCNVGLGHFKDDKQVLLKAADYVDTWFNLNY